jgi:hypothetical protein
VTEYKIPSASALGANTIATASFHDSYLAPLTRPKLGIVEIYFALFGHTPRWMKLLLIVRNAAAPLAGLEAPTVAEIIKPDVRENYSVGDKIGRGRFSSLATMKLSRAATTSTSTSGYRFSKRFTAMPPAPSSRRSAPFITFSAKSTCSSLFRFTAMACGH